MSEGEAFGSEHFSSLSTYSAVAVRMSHLFYVSRDIVEEVLSYPNQSRRSMLTKENLMRGQSELTLFDSVGRLVREGESA